MPSRHRYEPGGAILSPDSLRELAAESGFDLVRFGPVDPGSDGKRFLRWLDLGREGEMHYLRRNARSIADPMRLAPDARSTVALAADYGGPPSSLSGGGRVARYASGRDYHRVLGDATRKIRARLEAEGVDRGSIRIGTDAVPLLERALAVRAGIGFLAKSAGVISPSAGPWLLLSELLVPFELPVDAPAAGSCGTCTRCLQACPTGAIVAPYEVDATRCLSYTTIELRGPIPEELRAPQKDWLFGCDICIEVCPFTRFSRTAASVASRPAWQQPHPVLQSYTLAGILELGEAQYAQDWTGTAMRRATRRGLRRNAAVVLGNLGDPAAVPALGRALRDEDPLVRGHAAWALGRLDGGRSALLAALPLETAEDVRREIQDALERGGAR